MARTHWSITMIIAILVFVQAYFSPGFRSVTQAAEKLTMDSIIAGAKKEGKISWGTNLRPHEVKKLNKAFQKEYPFIKEISYRRARGGEQAERLISEMQAGIYPYDLIHTQPELVSRYRKLGFLMDPIDWKGLFSVDPQLIIPGGFGVSVGNNPAGVVYNKAQVSKDRIPKKWSDCADPFFKGRVSVDVRPSHMLSVWAGYGEEWTLDFARKLLANKPRWIRGNTAATLLVAAGELLISCPASHGSWYRQAGHRPDFPAGFVFPEGPIVAGRDLNLSPVKGSASPNTAILLGGWIATKGVTILDTGRESLLHPGTRLGKRFKETKREIKVQTWGDFQKEEERQKKILGIWGFPKPSN